MPRQEISINEEIHVKNVAQVALFSNGNKAAHIEICGDGMAQQVTVGPQNTLFVELYHNPVTIKNKSKAVVRVSW